MGVRVESMGLSLSIQCYGCVRQISNFGFNLVKSLDKTKHLSILKFAIYNMKSIRASRSLIRTFPKKLTQKLLYQEWVILPEGGTAKNG